MDSALARLRLDSSLIWLSFTRILFGFWFDLAGFGLDLGLDFRLIWLGFCIFVYFYYDFVSIIASRRLS